MDPVPTTPTQPPATHSVPTTPTQPPATHSVPTTPTQPPATIRRLLIANRGEVARRVIATSRRLGIETVAVHSDADTGAAYVAEADLAVRLPGTTPAETYLRADRLVDAAQRTGADAVHPGYGFLAENAEFAAAVADAGLVWVGPPAKAIAAMGSKVDAKALLAQSGVPMLPSWTRQADINQFPVLVKASAGGGGRGMRLVTSADQLEAAWAAASREAQAAFGDGTVFAEPYLPRARHIEVQAIADTYGTVVPLGERECSIQRRHQKIVEEAPSPAVPTSLREALFAAAVTAAQVIGYVNAGTVEFLLDPETGEFFFLEMNTRLQVEHPVTECVTGLDLVRLQLLVAEGRALPFTTPPAPQGHAIEVRLYAEDPTQDWRPSAGSLHRFTVPHDLAFAPLRRPGVRLDSAVGDGSTISAHYDAMLAKVVAWAPTRDEAARALADTLRRAHLHGVTTNRDLLVRILREPEFLAGATDTAYLDRHPEVFVPLLAAEEDRRLVVLAAALAGSVDPTAPWHALPSGWRNVVSAPQRVSFTAPWGPVEAAYRLDRTGGLAEWSVNGETQAVILRQRDQHRVVLEADRVRHTFDINPVTGVTYVDSASGSVALVPIPRFSQSTVEEEPGSLLASMPGTVGRVLVRAGDPVAAGEALLTIESMKMEHLVRAPESGTVTEIRVAPGDQVEPGALLAVVRPLHVTGMLGEGNEHV